MMHCNRYFICLLVTHRYLRYAVVKIMHVHNYTTREHTLEMEITSYQCSKLNVTEKSNLNLFQKRNAVRMKT